MGAIVCSGSISAAFYTFTVLHFQGHNPWAEQKNHYHRQIVKVMSRFLWEFQTTQITQSFSKVLDDLSEAHKGRYNRLLATGDGGEIRTHIRCQWSLPLKEQQITDP